MSLSNTGSSQKVSDAIISLGYLHPDARCGVTLFSAPVRARVRWATGASRGDGMATDGVGVGSGVGVGEGVNSWERVC